MLSTDPKHPQGSINVATETHDATAVPNKRLGLTLQEVAAALNVSYDTVWRLVKSGDLPSVKLTKDCIRVRPDALRAWLEQREQQRNDV